MSLKRAYDYWRDVFSSELDRAKPGLSAVPHQAVEGYHDYRGYRGAIALQRGNRIVISIPPTELARVGALVGTWQALDLKLLAEFFSDWSERIVGPVVQAYLEPSDFVPVPDNKARALTPDDTDLITDLQQACDPTAWSHSGISPQDEDLFGCFEGSTLVSIAKLLPWNTKANNVGVITHPTYRGRACGAAAVSTLIRDALEADKLVLYQTLKTNVGAVKLAQKLGFKTFGESLSIRFKPELKTTNPDVL